MVGVLSEPLGANEACVADVVSVVVTVVVPEHDAIIPHVATVTNNVDRCLIGASSITTVENSTSAKIPRLEHRPTRLRM